jgi:hypothetical protein
VGFPATVRRDTRGGWSRFGGLARGYGGGMAQQLNVADLRISFVIEQARVIGTYEH